MSQQELLKRVVQALSRAGIKYMLTGSFASSLQGGPRSSQDRDLVVDIKPNATSDLVQSFPPPRFHLHEERVAEAVARRDMLNLIDSHTGNKVDFWLLTDEPVDKVRFSGSSVKQFTDFWRVYEVQFGTLDIAYLHGWSKKIAVQDLLKEIEVEAKTVAIDDASTHNTYQTTI